MKTDVIEYVRFDILRSITELLKSIIIKETKQIRDHLSLYTNDH